MVIFKKPLQWYLFCLSKYFIFENSTHFVVLTPKSYLTGAGTLHYMPPRPQQPRSHICTFWMLDTCSLLYKSLLCLWPWEKNICVTASTLRSHLEYIMESSVELQLIMSVLGSAGTHVEGVALDTCLKVCVHCELTSDYSALVVHQLLSAFSVPCVQPQTIELCCLLQAYLAPFHLLHLSPCSQTTY